MKAVLVLAALVCLAVADHPSPGKVVELTSENFEQVINGERPAVVEFYATWCPHCKKFKADYEGVAADLGQDFIVARVDGEKFDKLADDYGITGYPTVKFIRKGAKATPAKAEEYEGAMKKTSLEQWLKSNGAAPAAAAQSHIQMMHLQPELENLLSLPERCYRSERSLYLGH